MKENLFYYVRIAILAGVLLLIFASCAAFARPIPVSLSENVIFMDSRYVAKSVRFEAVDGSRQSSQAK
jgi:hypothetical protein